jgi:hypothetical protein
VFYREDTHFNKQKQIRDSVHDSICGAPEIRQPLKACCIFRKARRKKLLTANTANTKNIINYKSDQQLNEVQGIKVDDDGGGRQ